MMPKPKLTPKPITDPDYQYIPSPNPYYQKILTEGFQTFLDHQTESHSGQWKSLLHKPQSKLHVEIGCNGGHVTLGQAKLCPDDLWIGLDWKYKQIYLAGEKAKKREIHNAAFFRAHGARLPAMFAPGEIDFLYLFFPDPWPKKSQTKHRIFTREWLKKIAPLITGDGHFEIRTDHEGYFDWMNEEVKHSPDWKIIHLTRNRHKDQLHPEHLNIPEVTLFEKVFIREKLPIYQMILMRH